MLKPSGTHFGNRWDLPPGPSRSPTIKSISKGLWEKISGGKRTLTQHRFGQLRFRDYLYPHTCSNGL